MGHLFYIFPVSGPIEPLHARLLAEPRQLASRVPPGIPLNSTYCFIPTVRRVKIGQYLPVTDRFERFGSPRNAAIQKLTNFIDKAGFEHLNNPLIDPRI